jgi:hypothetical protein
MHNAIGPFEFYHETMAALGGTGVWRIMGRYWEPLESSEVAK